jgi:hypothetical protein
MATTFRALPLVVLMGTLMGTTALAQGPTYGVGRTPTAEEIRVDISIGPTGEEPLAGRGSAKGAQVIARRVPGCHGVGNRGLH